MSFPRYQVLPPAIAYHLLFPFHHFRLAFALSQYAITLELLHFTSLYVESI